MSSIHGCGKRVVESGLTLPSVPSILRVQLCWNWHGNTGDYGFWKWRMPRRYPDTLRWRQALPPLFVLSLVGLSLFSIFIPFARFVLIGELIIYFFIMTLAGLYVAYRQKKKYLLPGLPLAIPVMHITWGGGFLWSMLASSKQKHG